MGGKDSNHASARASREATASYHASPRSVATVPFYRQFLPTQLSGIISAHDPIPSLEELSALAKHLARIKTESLSRLSRLESRGVDLYQRIFTSSSHDLFSPPGLSSAPLHLYSDQSRPSSVPVTKEHKSRERTFNVSSPARSAPNALRNGSPTSIASKGKFKIKRERDNDSAPASTSALYAGDRSPHKLASFAGKAGVRNKAVRGNSLDLGADDESIASTDPDWDLDEDSLPSRPGRTYGKNKKRKRKESGFGLQDEESGSDLEASSILGGSSTRAATGSQLNTPLSTASATRSAAAVGSRRGSEAGLPNSISTSKISTFGMRLKVNPAHSASGATSNASIAASQTSPNLQTKGSDTTKALTRRNSVMPSPSPFPSTPLAHPITAPSVPMYEPAPGWELPTITPASFMPVLEKSRLPRPYPTKPQDVNEDFALKDWKEKERERDRLLERESVGPGTLGAPGPGQSMVKEATTARRGGRDLQQTPITTFYNYADAFFKTLTEDDLAWLSSKSDDHEPFQMPALGRHYKEIWQEEDAQLFNGVDAVGNPLNATTMSRSPSLSLAAASVGNAGLPLDPNLVVSKNGEPIEEEANSLARPDLDLSPPPHFKPRQMTDQHLGFEFPAAVEARSGPLTERLVASLLSKRTADGDETVAQTAISNGNGFHLNGLSQLDDDEVGDEDADGEPDLDLDGLMHDQDMASFEERIAKELKAIEVFGADESVDWATRADDEISTTLRMVQRQLACQQKINELRKGRLFNIAKDRMAYQDYLNCLNSIEKEIEAGWAKRLRQIKASLGKRKKGAHGQSTSHADEAIALSQTHAVNGLNSASGTPQPGTYNGPVRPQLPEALVNAMDRRQKLRLAFKDMFEQDKHAWQTPTESVYADLHLDEIE